MAFEIAKAGWLYRQTSLLKRWKRNWFVLYLDGNLKYFQTPNDHEAQDVLMVASQCQCIRTGREVKDVQTPEHHDYLIELVMKDKSWFMCAESLDDMSAWKIALEQARVAAGRSVNHLATIVDGDYNSTDQPPPYVIQGPDGQLTVVYPQNVYHQHNYDGIGMGVLGGAAIGTMMWAPLLWW